jgi:Asparaginase
VVPKSLFLVSFFKSIVCTGTHFQVIFTAHVTPGRGAVFTADGTHEMEASIMDGSNLKVME